MEEVQIRLGGKSTVLYWEKSHKVLSCYLSVMMVPTRRLYL